MKFLLLFRSRKSRKRAAQKLLPESWCGARLFTRRTHSLAHLTRLLPPAATAAFATAADAAIVSLEGSGFQVGLEFEDFVRRIYGASGGRVPMMMRLLKTCALGIGKPREMGLADLHRAASSMQQSCIPTASFFESRDPDEVDLMRSFAAIMSEAGLEFSVETLAGLGVEWGAQAG